MHTNNGKESNRRLAQMDTDVTVLKVAAATRKDLSASIRVHQRLVFHSRLFVSIRGCLFVRNSIARGFAFCVLLLSNARGF
jgi:hypothetical protein